jgi:hypothetical protein
MGRKSSGWIEQLEQKYKLDARVLIPALLTQHGAEWLSQETGVTLATISRWCSSHGVERRIVYGLKQGEPT